MSCTSRTVAASRDDAEQAAAEVPAPLVIDGEETPDREHVADHRDDADDDAEDGADALGEARRRQHEREHHIGEGARRVAEIIDFWNVASAAFSVTPAGRSLMQEHLADDLVGLRPLRHGADGSGVMGERADTLGRQLREAVRDGATGCGRRRSGCGRRLFDQLG